MFLSWRSSTPSITFFTAPDCYSVFHNIKFNIAISDDVGIVGSMLYGPPKESKNSARPGLEEWLIKCQNFFEVLVKFSFTHKDFYKLSKFAFLLTFSDT